MASAVENPVHDILLRPDHHKNFYNATERNIVNPFKDVYLKAKDASERKHVAINEIFPALFNHWVTARQLSFTEGQKKD